MRLVKSALIMAARSKWTSIGPTGMLMASSDNNRRFGRWCCGVRKVARLARLKDVLAADVEIGLGYPLLVPSA